MRRVRLLALLLGGEDLGCLLQWDLGQLHHEGPRQTRYTCSGSACLISLSIVSVQGTDPSTETRNCYSRRKRIWIISAIVGHLEGLGKRARFYIRFVAVDVII